MLTPISSCGAANGSPGSASSANVHESSTPVPQMMRVGRVHANVSDFVNQIKSRGPALPRRVRTPNCTHVNMDRIYGREHHCYVCGRSPSIGFLYECRQDCDTIPLREKLQGKAVENEKEKSELRSELEEIGLSESVILTAELGGYTKQQLEKLKSQKQELRQRIGDVIQGTQINTAAARLAASAKGPSNHDGAFNSILGKDLSPTTCNFRACHTCRPYYKDRIYISFAAVLHNDFPPMDPSDIETLPTKSADIMRFIGLTPSPSLTQDTTHSTLPTSTDLSTEADLPSPCASVLTFKTTQTDMEEISAQRRPRRRFYNLGHRSSGDIARDLSTLPPLFSRQGLKSVIQGIFRPSTRDSSSSGSNITLPLPRTGTARDLNQVEAMGEFDIGTLRRVRRQKERNDLLNGSYVYRYEDVHRQPLNLKRTASEILHEEGNQGRDEEMILAACFPGRMDKDRTRRTHEDNSSDSDFTVYSCASEGSEVEVNGGVALTEEAVETHTPDILNGGEKETTSTRFCMDNIMTQA